MYPQDRQKQPELFDKFSEPNMAASGDKHREHKLGLFKRLMITISYETVTISCILVLMATILSFAIGFERGKKISKQSAKLTVEGAIKELKKQPLSEKSPDIAEPEKPKSKEKEQKINFAVQLIAYAKKDYALKELEKLKKIGYTPFIDQGKRFFLVSIGPYINHQQAKRILKKIKSDSLYRDAFIKRMSK